jgi:hypothetical protein
VDDRTDVCVGKRRLRHRAGGISAEYLSSREMVILDFPVFDMVCFLKFLSDFPVGPLDS